MSAVPKYPRELGYAGLRMTTEEYLSLPETQERYELIDGVVVMSPCPSSKHQRIIRRLLAQLDAACDRISGLEAFPEYDVALAPGLVYRPDAVAFAPGRFRDDEHSIVPDLVIEVLSPSTKAYDLITKRGDYERYGVGEYWIIDPEDGALRCWRRQGARLIEAAVEGDSLACETIAGLVLDLRALRRVGER